MVKFNELQIGSVSGTPALILDVEVLNYGTSFDNVYIRRIVAIKASDYSTSLDPINSTEVTPIYDTGDLDTYESWKKYGILDAASNVFTTKHIKSVILNTDFSNNTDLTKDLIVIYVYTGSVNNITTESGNDTLSITANESLLTLITKINSGNWKSSDEKTISIEDAYFVWTAPKVGEEVCCNLAKNYDTALVYNMCNIYNKIMQSIKTISNNCTLLSDFTAVYINYLAFKYAIQTHNYPEAIIRYEKMFDNNNYITIKSCGCNE